jgi:type IV pilus assembly protein PilE
MYSHTSLKLLQRKSEDNGFTLIELMIAIAIIAILAAIAIPNYSQYIVRSKLTESTSALADVRVRMEQFYQDNRNYGTTTSCSNTSLPISAPASDYFTFTCGTTTGAQSYTITASSQAGKGLGASAGDYAYTVNQANQKSTTKYKGTTKTNKSCWLISGSEC